MNNAEQPFFIEDQFYSDLESFIDHQDFADDDEIIALPDDWTQKIHTAKEEPILQVDERFIDRFVERLCEWNEDRFPEDSDYAFKGLKKAITESIDFEKMQTLMPKLWYPDGGSDTITKQDLLDYITPNPEHLNPSQQ